MSFCSFCDEDYHDCHPFDDGSYGGDGDDNDCIQLSFPFFPDSRQLFSLYCGRSTDGLYCFKLDNIPKVEDGRICLIYM